MMIKYWEYSQYIFDEYAKAYHQEYNKKRYEENKEEMKAKMKIYWAANKKTINAKRKAKKLMERQCTNNNGNE